MDDSQERGGGLASAMEGHPQFRGHGGVSRLAAAAGISRTTLYNYLNGTRDPGGEELSRLAEALGVPESQIAGTPLTAVHEPTPEYDSGDVPTPDPHGSPAEQLLHYLGVREGFRRVAMELTDKDIIAAAYTMARKYDYSIDEMRKIDRWRDQILKESGNHEPVG